MASLNEVSLIGHLGADPELRYTNSQVPVSNFNVATTETWNDNNGQKHEETEWHRIVVWQKTAENCCKYLTKGRQVWIRGKLKTRKWTKDGVDHYTTEVHASHVQFLGANPNKDGAQPQAQAKPQQQPAQQEPSGSSGAPPVDDIPF